MRLLELKNRVVKAPAKADSSFLESHQTAHPQPLLKRSQWQNLNGLWKFAFDQQGKHVQPSDLSEWTDYIEVPFTPESIKSGINDQSFHANCWYEREFETPPGEGRLLLHFGAVDYRARVWVNNQYIAEHEGGYTAFTLDITHALNDSGTNTITVWAQDDPQDLAKPRGKQDWQLKPHSIWYPRTSGIWQTVWLERVGTTYLGNLRWVPDCERWEIGFEAALAGEIPTSGIHIKVKLTVDDLVLASDTYEVFNGEISRRLALGDPGIDDCRNDLLWSPEKPTLIQANIQIWFQDQLLDEVQSYTALRTVSIQRDRFMLNGRPYYLRLVLDQGYWPDTLMTPPSDQALKLDIELVKAMGFNGVRKHQKIEDPRFLYWADVLGLLVWEEMPSAYRFTPKAVERLTREWTEVIKRDVSHPCIVAWVPFNESWGVPNLVESAAHRNYVLAIYHLTKTLDPTRPVIGNDGWESTHTDILAIHDYDCKPEQLAQRYRPDIKITDLFERKRPGGRILTLDNYPHQGQPVMLTEFGGIAYVPHNQPNAEQAWGYEHSSSVAELEHKYAALLATVNNIELFSGFCYTQLTDTFQEANGLLYADRTPKFPLEAIRTATLFGQGLCTPDSNSAADHGTTQLQRVRTPSTLF